MFLLHPVHVSISNIEYVQEAKQFEISIKVFTDDFERAVAQKYGVDLKLGKTGELNGCEQYITGYITDHFDLLLNKESSKSNMVYSHKKMNEEAVWFFYKMKINEEIQTIKVINSIHNDIYRDQTNLLIFKCENIEQGYQLDYDDTEVLIKLK